VAGRAGHRGWAGVPPLPGGDRTSECHHRGHAHRCAGPPESALGCLGWREPEQAVTLRWIILHMIEETAGHAGRLGTVRELLDGRTGLG
jgi:uncharacterized protein DUF664